MPDYLILKRTGPGELDLKACAVVRGKTADEVDEAIAEGAFEGQGNYLALSLGSAEERTMMLKPEVLPVAEAGAEGEPTP